ECYWQQHVDYKMIIDMDVNTFQYKGKQELIYTNNSTDTLNRVFYHLYFNAFQPNSEMDIHSRSVSDPDKRVKDRISKLKLNEIGYIDVEQLTQDGEKVDFTIEGTILEVKLSNPIAPNSSVVFKMDFNAQVPVQIRRSGRNNKEGVALSMTQWYPKMAEYDFEGWHADPYIAREFHGVWGDFDVTINIDKNYTIGGTGILQNPNEIGHGYETKNVKQPKGETLSWHFKASKVHDFAWAADTNFIHDKAHTEDGVAVHFLYKNDLSEQHKNSWEKLQTHAVQSIEFFSELIGDYPYKQYSVIQGGDGGMEYAMCTLVTGKRSLNSLVGVTVHEIAHAWFQFLLATNETKHYWMDEGFASYIEELALAKFNSTEKENIFTKAYKDYIKLVLSGKEQPLSTHADRYKYNDAYWTAAYDKGLIFVSQLAYIIGKENLIKTFKEYYNNWAFKHPTPQNFIRTAELVSNMELDWYLTDWTQTTNTIDYSVNRIYEKDNETFVSLKREGLMPMPLEVEVEYKNGEKDLYYIPLRMMRGEKPVAKDVVVLTDWAWAYPNYTFKLKAPKKEIKKVTIDPDNFIADINKYNNTN
ncbi:MAG: M1 family metallopeptidase, partial [Bacteroidia bacterium]|nr:M1 family metallopeptidase [Bacteroidia bacterium]